MTEWVYQQRYDSKTELEMCVGLSPQRSRTGYVRVPETHPLFRVYYTGTYRKFADRDYVGNAYLPFSTQAKIADMHDREKKRLDEKGVKHPTPERCPEVILDVHGGITFSGSLAGLEGWWIGFDCAHYRDYIPEMHDGRLAESDPDLFQKRPEGMSYEEHAAQIGERYWTEEEVWKECQRLATQIAEYPHDDPCSEDSESSRPATE